jgi:hypothetical protein
VLVPPDQIKNARESRKGLFFAQLARISHVAEARESARRITVDRRSSRGPLPPERTNALEIGRIGRARALARRLLQLAT